MIVYMILVIYEMFINFQICNFNLQDEVFELWKYFWGNFYFEGFQFRKIIDYIFDSYYLVNLVDNDFFKDFCLWRIVEQMLEVGRQILLVEEMDVNGQW